jgi:hypothetical protein
MRQSIVSSALLAGTFSATGLAAAGTPVLNPRASTTVTPITVTGNGMLSLSKFEDWKF